MKRSEKSLKERNKILLYFSTGYLRLSGNLPIKIPHPPKDKPFQVGVLLARQPLTSMDHFRAQLLDIAFSIPTTKVCRETTGKWGEKRRGPKWLYLPLEELLARSVSQRIPILSLRDQKVILSLASSTKTQHTTSCPLYSRVQWVKR